MGGYFLAAMALAGAPVPSVYPGICDGSAVILTGPDRFVTISDEEPAIYGFPLAGGPSISRLDLRAALGLPADKEGDFEAAARIGDTIYWIASFGANKNGKAQPTRRQFFATSVAADNTLTVLGSAPGDNGARLFGALINHPKLSGYDWAKAATTPPKSVGGISIEGLAATPSGALMIAFRNAPPEKGKKKREKALVVILTNPAEAAAGATPILSDVVPIDLGGRGVRDIVYRPARGDFLILAGAIDSSGKFALYRWSDTSGRKPHKLFSDFGALNPEGLTLLNDGRLLVLSDDGEVPDLPGGAICKDVPAAQKKFRGMILPSPD